MREVFVCPPEKQSKCGRVYRLKFDATGRELVAWVDGKARLPWNARKGSGLYAFDRATDGVRQLLADEWFSVWADSFCNLVVSPDMRFLAAPGDIEDAWFVLLEDLRGAAERSTDLPLFGYADELIFSADSSELLAVRNVETDDALNAHVARFKLSSFLKPPLRFEEGVNPFTGEPYRHPVRDLDWDRVCGLPSGSPTSSVALSANGRLLAVGTEDALVHVVDLKRKKVVASLPWEGRPLRYTAITKLALDPAAERVVLAASNRLFGRPFGAKAGASWKAKPAFGDVRDFAFHPNGRVLCAVFEDGCARFLDPNTGADKQEFRWKRGPLCSVCFAPDGLTCAAGAGGGRAILWDVDA